MARRIVVLGAGYGGLRAALDLEKRLSNCRVGVEGGREILLVDRHDYHQHIIVLHQVAAGSISPKDALVPLAHLLRGRRISFLQGEVKGVDLERRIIDIDGRQVSYHRLVLALGSETDFHGIPGVEQNSFALKSVDDARCLNAQIRRMFTLSRAAAPEERRPMLTFLVGGGGFTGTELAGELADWLPELALTSQVPVSNVRLLVVEVNRTILPGFGRGAKRRAIQVLREKGVELRTGVRVVEVEPGKVHLESGEVVPTRTLIWTGGVRGHHLLAQWGLETGARGQAVINDYLESTSHQGVYVIGDSALAMDADTGRPIAPSAQLALQQGAHVAKNVAAEISDQPRRAFRPKPMGEVLSLGRRQAIATFGPFTFDGYRARLLKEMASLRYLHSIGGTILALQKLPASLRASRSGSRASLARP